tara:strand:- start:201 stop:1418 length:1218 start_codon:yes stop_codon:yes gene_type:complete
MEIYQPAEDSYLLQKQVRELSFGRVLELGTGSGIQAITANKNKPVREVVAVDINPQAVRELQQKVREKGFKKIIVRESDLFSAVTGKFDTIIFNPPYLPQDKGIVDQTLYGGKHGWELSAKFLSEVSKYLIPDGKILFLFSTLTNKEKIEELIRENLLEYKKLVSQKLAWEELFVYQIEKSQVLRMLESKGVEHINYLAHGKRGDVFVAELDKSKLVKTHFPGRKNIVKVAIKVRRKESQALNRMENETYWLQILNKKGIGPKLFFSGIDFFVYKFADGELILDWLYNSHRTEKEIKKMFLLVLEQCYLLDRLGVNKEEMHHPFKHILIDKFGQPIMIDFERCNRTEKPKNVTQFIEFISRLKKELAKKRMIIDVEQLRKLAGEYKSKINQEKFKIILKELHLVK